MGKAKDVSDQTPSSEQDAVIPVVEEELLVQTQRVERGRVKVLKQVESREEVFHAPAVHESVVIERIPINRFLDSEIPQVREEGELIVIPVIEEVLLTEKRSLLREEIWISTRRMTEHSSQTVSLLREFVEIERLPFAAPPLRGTNTSSEADIAASEPEPIAVAKFASTNDSDPVETNEKEIVIPVVAEEITIDMQRIARARIHARKRIETIEDSIDTSRVRYDFVVERIPVKRFVDEKLLPMRQESDVLVIPVVEEIMVTEKRLFLREEVRITKHRTTATVPHHITLRREIIDIKRIESDGSPPPQ
jgi:uncharacterized protein (TIGR02271 family)